MFFKKRNKYNIAELPKKKNIINFTDKEIFYWLEDYIENWGKGYGVTPPVQYEIVKAELMRRNNERMLLLTRVNLALGIVVLIFAVLTCWKSFFPTGIERYERHIRENQMLSIDRFTGRVVNYIKDDKAFSVKKEIWDKGDWRRFFIDVE